MDSTRTVKIKMSSIYVAVERKSRDEDVLATVGLLDILEKIGSGICDLATTTYLTGEGIKELEG